MLKITKRDGSPYWQITGTYQGVRLRESTGTGDKAQAEKILGQRIREIDSRRVGGKTVSDAIDAYIRFGAEDKYYGDIKDVVGHIALNDLTQEDIDKGASELFGAYKRGKNGQIRKYKTSTIKRQYYTPLAAALHYASDMKWMPYMRVKAPKPKRSAPKWAELPWFDKLWKVCDRDMKALTMFLMMTGCRIQECLDLEWQDVNLEEGSAFIRKTKTSEHRTVRLPDMLIEALGEPGKGKVFKYRDRRQVGYFLQKACKEAKIEYLSTHQLGSHTFATLMRRHAGMDARGLIATGRWKSINSANHYTHTNLSEESKRADLLASAFDTIIDTKKRK